MQGFAVPYAGHAHTPPAAHAPAQAAPAPAPAPQPSQGYVVPYGGAGAGAQPYASAAPAPHFAGVPGGLQLTPQFVAQFAASFPAQFQARAAQRTLCVFACRHLWPALHCSNFKAYGSTFANFFCPTPQWGLLLSQRYSYDQFKFPCQAYVCCMHASWDIRFFFTRPAEVLAGWRQAQLAQQLGSIPAAQYAAALAAARPQQPAQPQQVCGSEDASLRQQLIDGIRRCDLQVFGTASAPERLHGLCLGLLAMCSLDVRFRKPVRALVSCLCAWGSYMSVLSPCMQGV